MPRQTPEVLAGQRGPRSERIEAMRAAADADPEQVQVPAHMTQMDGTLYMSKYPSYTVQLTSPATIVDPLTGRKQTGQPIKAQFKNGAWLNAEKNKNLRKQIDEQMQANSRYGIGLDFWLEADFRAAVKVAEKRKVKNLLSSMKREEVEAFIAELKQGTEADHTLPAV